MDELNVPLTSDVSIATLLDSMPDAILIADRAGRIMLANVKSIEVFGYAQSELVGMSVEDLLPSRYREAHVRHREAYNVAPHPRDMGGNYLELYGLRRGGAEFPVAISLAPFGSARVVATVRDQSLAQRAARAQPRRRGHDRIVSMALGAGGGVVAAALTTWGMRRRGASHVR